MVNLLSQKTNEDNFFFSQFVKKLKYLYAMRMFQTESEVAIVPLSYKRWNEIKLTSLWSPVVTSSSMPSHYTTRDGGVLWRDSRITQTYSSGGKQANRDWWNQLQDWHQILQARNSSIPKIHSRSSKVIFSLHIRSPTLRHSTSSGVAICTNILPVFCRIGIFVCTLAWLNKKTELYVTTLRGYTTISTGWRQRRTETLRIKS